jgi:hypothetical protein
VIGPVSALPLSVPAVPPVVEQAAMASVVVTMTAVIKPLCFIAAPMFIIELESQDTSGMFRLPDYQETC